MDGVEATRRLCVDPAAPKVLVLTTLDTDEDAFAELQAVPAVSCKNVSPQDLLGAIRAVVAGDAVVAPW